MSLWHGEGDGQDAVGTNHGTLMGGAGFASGVSGQGFLLDGANDYIRVVDSASLHLADELTIEMWFKRADGASYGPLIDKRNFATCNFGASIAPGWGFQLYYDDPGFHDGNQYEISFSPVPSAGVFHHFAGTYRQADSNHVELKIYIDGQLAQTDTLRGNLTNTFNEDVLSIGSARDGAPESFFRGVIDEVAIYNYALSASEVQSNYTVIVTNLPPPPPPPPPPTPALVSLWRGEMDAQDSAGTNHGALMGGVGFASGVAGQGFMLDGVNDHVRVPDSSSLHLANELTVELWFKRVDESSYGPLIDKRNWTTCNFGVIMSPGWGFQLYYDDPAVRDGNQYEISFSPIPSAGSFHHFAGTYRQVDSSHVELKTYIDGELAQTDVLRGNLADTFNGDALSIGAARDGDPGGGFFRGVIDEVAIYNYALSASHIQSNYTAIVTNLPPPPPPPPPPTPTLISLWHGDGDAQDAAGTNHGTLMGGAGFTAGVSGQGFLLDGLNDYIRVPDSSSLHLANELTIEMWFKREDSSSYGPLIDKRNFTTCNFGVIMSPEWGFQLYYDDPNIHDGNQYEISFSPVPAPDVFHHLAGTFRQLHWGHVELKTYIDGQLARTDTLRGNLANTFNGDPLSIGAARDGDPGGGFFRGVIDEVAIYNHALSAAQVQSNYTAIVTNLPPPPPPPPPSTNTGGLVALWHGDGDAQDSAGSNHGILSGGVNFAGGVSGQGFLFDGVNDYVRVPNSTSLHLSNELTLEMWFQRANSSSYGTLIDKRNPMTCNFGVIMSAEWGFQLYYDDPNIRDGNQYEISFSGVPSAGIFHHLAGTYRQVGSSHVELKTYLDGQLVRTDVLRGNLANTFNGDALAIGSARDGADGFFHGVIDEVALYSRALSASEILSNYTSVAMALQILAQPQSVTVVQGDNATFTVHAVGAAPLSHQWRFEGTAITGQTNSSLTLSGVSSANAGGYDVVVANASGSVTSVVATLTVTSSGLPPSFIVPPLVLYTAAEGSTLGLNATVAGTPPLAFQWTFNGVAIPAATNVSLVLSNVQPENAGAYRLAVSNDYGAIVSGGSSVNVIPSQTGGTILFANSPSNLVYDIGSSSPVPTNAGYVAALYVGTESNSLTSVGGTAVFVLPGRFFGGMRSVPTLSPGQTVNVQVRVWDSRVSSTYEEAVALGAKHGASALFQIAVGGSITPPALLTPMPSFSLQPGTGIAKRRVVRAPSLRSGLQSPVRSANGTSFVLTGAAGSVYAIETSSDLVNWTTLDYVINNSGAVQFTDTSSSAGQRRFYRARMISP